MKSSLSNRIGSSIIALGAYKLGSLIKINHIFGTLFSYFSLSQVTVPTVGLLGGPAVSLLNYGLQTLYYGLNHPLPAALLYHLPTLCAALYLTRHNKLAKLTLLAACSILFILHPVGGQAWFYTLFWLIPAGIAIKNSNTLFLRALGATFTAHAVGSTLFIYTHVTDPLLWKSLMIVVPFERLAFAAGIAISYSMATGTIEYLEKLTQKLLEKAANHG